MVYGVHLVWYILGNVKDWLSSLHVGKENLVIIVLVLFWMVVPHCLTWCIWRERNNWCFEDFERIVADVKLFFFKTLSDWISIVGSYFIFLVYDLMDACNLCV